MNEHKCHNFDEELHLWLLWNISVISWNPTNKKTPEDADATNPKNNEEANFPTYIIKTIVIGATKQKINIINMYFPFDGLHFKIMSPNAKVSTGLCPMIAQNKARIIDPSFISPNATASTNP